MGAGGAPAGSGSGGRPTSIAGTSSSGGDAGATDLGGGGASQSGGKANSLGGRAGHGGDAGAGGPSNVGGEAGAGGDAAGGSGPIGAVPGELVGIWQETRASGGEYVSSSGATFSATTGFSAELRIRANGSYRYSHLASGVSTTCSSVTYFDQSVGTAVLEGETLVLYPRQHRIDVQDCVNPGSIDVGPEPIRLTIGLSEAQHFYGGLRTYRMHAEGGPHPLDLTLLHRPPLSEPFQPEQPTDFTLGTDGPFQEIQGLWVPAPGTDSNFIDLGTGEYYFPELNGSPHQWVRFAGNAYEAAVALQNINAEGACKSDVIYYERGEGKFALLEDVNAQGNHFLGHNRFAAEAALMVVRIRNCDEDDAELIYELPPTTSYYRWIYFSPENPPESFTLGCNFTNSEWQSLFCTNQQTSFLRRE